MIVDRLVSMAFSFILWAVVIWVSVVVLTGFAQWGAGARLG